ncbi:MAG: hypothetical protein IKR74_01695 [Bacilli bacterium]|nr:hypothetical protein [Bacilli bacterium]
MTKKIIKVEDTKKKKNANAGLDLGKIKNVIDNNPEAVKKITEGLGELIINKSAKKTTKSKTIKKTNKKSSTSDVTNTIKTISNLLGK